MNWQQFEEFTEALAMEAFLAARKLPGVSDALASEVRAAVLNKADDIAVAIMGEPRCTCLPAGPGHDHSDDCALEKWRKERKEKR
jgi:hypothetical protein